MENVFQYRQYKGKPEDITFRTATQHEHERCMRVMEYRKTKVPSMIVFFIVSLAFCFYFSTQSDEPIFRYGPYIIPLLALISIIISIFREKKCESFEIAEGTLVGFKYINKKPYASVWCEKDQIYLPTLRYFSVFHRQFGMPLLIVKGYRGEGKKPRYFVISYHDDPLI